MKYSYNSIKSSLHSQEPWVNVFLLKYITLPLVYVMVNYTKITPNIISLLSLMFGLFSAYNYFLGDVLLGGAMYFVSYIFDATDGKVARIKDIGKPYGAWLDICIDRLNLIIIATSIAYNGYVKSGDINIIFLNCFFLGLAFVGWESRYNIDYYKLKHKTKGSVTKSEYKYHKWCVKKGVIKAPITLPELFLFYLIFSPILKLEFHTLSILIFFLIIRLIAQQKFWLDVIKNK